MLRELWRVLGHAMQQWRMGKRAVCINGMNATCHEAQTGFLTTEVRLMSHVPTVRLEKPYLPTLSLDTSVVIKLVKIERGEALQDIEVQRGKRLQKLIFDLGRAGKLLCPESDQEEEYAAERLDDQVNGMFARLSQGISLNHRQGIYDEQVSRGMQAFAKKAESIDLPASSYFHGDPVRRLEEVRHDRFVVSVGPLKSPDLLRRRAQSKANIGRQWEQLRQELRSKGQTYERQLAVEQRGDAIAIVETLKKFEADITSGRHDFWNFMAATGPLMYRYFWRELRGQPPKWEGILQFFASPYFSELPQPYVASRMVAELLTGNEPIAPSDPMDVDLLSVALPISHFVLTDRRMELRVKKLGLDKRCSTEVYSMSSIDGLFAALEKLK